MSEIYAVVPVKSHSERVEDKNLRPFHGEYSLTEIKLITLREAGFKIIVSSNDPRAGYLAQKYGAIYKERPNSLCKPTTDLQHLLVHCLEGLEQSFVYWAHVTSPFVRVETMKAAAKELNFKRCVLGVEVRQDFLWQDEYRAVNYDPYDQPPSQDLDPTYRVTGGIHMARGSRFIATGAVSFAPATFVELDSIESIDINTESEWLLARAVASNILAWL